MNKTKVFFATVGVLVALLVIGVVGYQFNWWLAAKNKDRQVQLDNRNRGTQSAWADEARNAISDFNLVEPSNTAARGALRSKACTLTNRLTHNYLDADLASFQAREC